MDCDPFEKARQQKLDAVMPWIGMYITAASGVCTLAMAADAFNGFRWRKLWFPCRYFSLNAASLTLLAVAMKLTVDLGTDKLGTTDAFATLSSLIFMSTAMVNLVISLGSMNEKAILTNTVALGLLVITVVANMWIYIIQVGDSKFKRYATILVWLPTSLMLLLLAMLVSSAIALPTIKRKLESRYQEMHKLALREEEVAKRTDGFGIDKQMIGVMKKYWVMAETSCPQFVMARSVVCTTSSALCVLAVVGFPFFRSSMFNINPLIPLSDCECAYAWSTSWIWVTQLIGVVVGTNVPAFRWFFAVRLKCSTTCFPNFKQEFKIETHWTQTLVYWRDSFSTSQIGRHKCTKYIRGAKWFALSFCIGLQVFIVLLSKLLLFISTLLVTPFFLCFNRIKKFRVKHVSISTTSNNHIERESGDDGELNLSRYVLLLEDEAGLPEWILKNICRQMDEVIQTGKTQQPQNLIHLLSKFNNFHVVKEFDSIQVPKLLSQEPQNCWTLPLVTLTSIASALPNVANHKIKQLTSSVNEGLSLAKRIDKILDTSVQLFDIRKAANVTWVGVALHRKWQDIDLRRMSLKYKNSKDVLDELSTNARRTVVEFKRSVNDYLMENPLNWPVKVIAANSMYRISQTILRTCQEVDEQMDEALFERLSIMIADIFAACLTNLASVIISMCHRNAIEEREKSVRKAFLLLGKTEKILQLLQQHEWPSLDHYKAANVEEWRALSLPEYGSPAVP